MAINFSNIASKIGQSLDIASKIVDIRNGLKADKVRSAQGGTSTAPTQLAPGQIFIPQPVFVGGGGPGSQTPQGGLLQQVQNISPLGAGAIALGVGGLLAVVFLLVRR